MSAGRRALLRFGLLVLFALALQGIPFLYMMMEGDAGVVLYLLHLYAVMPMSAAGLAFWAGLGGVHPMAAFFPVGGALLLLPAYESMGVGLICLLISLIGAVAGQEWSKRKGKKHGKG
ncbi:MAG: hypothetical protein E7329_03755 [Clostridiales bacterium]|nr:hypothetical protein [Clostridiales bacterium]